ncbi:MAG: hypothetical protein MUF83_08355 [Acidimicrobiales bacterium]|jgi:hypothetical protein|nr:hypothetical protein [Acidimicrobiales bacterium]
MSPITIRRLVLAVFVGGIIGMIVSSVNSSTGGAITFGLITAAGAVALILVTSVAGSEAFSRGGAVDEETALDVETRIRRLVEQGTDEAELRQLVRRATELGRGRR